jgi:hypothetical protein
MGYFPKKAHTPEKNTGATANLHRKTQTQQQIGGGCGGSLLR